MGRRFSPGFKGKFRASEVNSWQAAAEAHQRSQLKRAQDSTSDRSLTHVLVRNDSGDVRPRFAVLGIQGFVIEPETDLGQFQQQVALLGVLPIERGHEEEAELQTEDSFVVLSEPIPDGKIGRAWASGTCPVQVLINDPSHRYARIIDDDASMLQTAESGPVVILWKEDGVAEDVVWAVIRWGGAPSGSTRYRVKVVHPDYIQCVSWDGTTEGAAVNIAKPYLFRGSLASHDGKTFSDYTSDGQRKLATQGGTVETWEITERWVLNDEIYAEKGPIGGTGVSVSGSPLTLLDTNKDGRNWAKLTSVAPPFSEGGAASPDEEYPFWNQGYSVCDGAGAELVISARVLDCGVLENPGAEIEVTGYASALAASALSGAGAATVGSGRVAAIGSGALSGAGASVVVVAKSGALSGAVALSGPGGMTVGWVA